MNESILLVSDGKAFYLSIHMRWKGAEDQIYNHCTANRGLRRFKSRLYELVKFRILR